MAETRFKIRFAKPNELGRVCQLVAKLHKFEKLDGRCETPKLKTLEVDLLQTNEEGELAVNQKNTFVAIAIDRSKEAGKSVGQSHIVGYMVYTQSFCPQRDRFMDLNHIFIEDAYRSQGLGEKFIKFISLHAKLLGNDALNLYCYKFNPHAIRFYERVGFHNSDDQAMLSKHQLD